MVYPNLYLPECCKAATDLDLRVTLAVIVTLAFSVLVLHITNSATQERHSLGMMSNYYRYKELHIEQYID